MLIACFFILALISCKKLVTVDEPINRLTSDLVFTSDKSATSAIAGLYSKILSSASFANSGMTVYAGMSADEITNTVSGTNDEFSKNNLSVSNSVIANNFWANGYNYIYHVNAIIEGLNTGRGMTDAVKNQLMGEAKFLRAFFYFNLTNVFSDMPLITKTSFAENSFALRSSSSEIYGQIISDLNDAKNLLNTSYATSGRVRPNKWTAAALLARAYLYRGDFISAEAESTTIINSGMYSLNNNLNNVFLNGSSEAIWQLMPNSNITANTQNVYEGSLFIPASGAVPAYSMTTHLLNSFETGDQRRINWVGTISVNGTVYYYPFKYKIRTAATITEYYMVFRLAEQYLIRAEARARQNKLDLGKADINMIRTRAGLLPISATSQTVLLNTIVHERQTELFAEWGHRFLDLKRTQKADEVLGPIKSPNWQSTDALYPIPQSQINLNHNLTQNQGY